MSNTLYRTSDLKLQAFLRLMLPDSFAGADRSSNRVQFQFTDSSQLQDLVRGYYTEQVFELAPFRFATLIDQGKSIVFGRAEFDST